MALNMAGWCLQLLSGCCAGWQVGRETCCARGGDHHMQPPQAALLACLPQMADLPLEPTLARMLLAAGELGCAAEVLTVVAMLSVQSVWAGGGRREVDEAKARRGWQGAEWQPGNLASRAPMRLSEQGNLLV
jgi:hypothetical protein